MPLIKSSSSAAFKTNVSEMIKAGKNLPCEVCGKIVYVVPYRQSAFRACSNSCRAKLCSVGRIEKQCEFCNAKFVVERWRNRAKYCSPDCYSGAKKKPRIRVECVVCGKSIDRAVVHLHKSGKNVCG